MAEQNGTIKPPANKGQSSGQGAPVPGVQGGASAGVSARLPSFRAPRDLTLSASTTALVKPSLMTRTRKTFSPNIPTKREKVDNSYETHSEKSSRKRDRDKTTKKEGGRGRGKNKEFIQTTGSLFGEGIAGATPRRGPSGGFGYGGGGGGGGGSTKAEAGYIHKPVLNLETVNNINKEHEDQKLKELLRDDFIDDPDDVVGHAEEDLFPIQLPLVTCGRGFKEEEEVKPPVPSSDLGVEVKKEPGDPSEEPVAATAVPEPKSMKMVSLKSGLPAQGKAPELSVAQLLSGKHEEVLFFQLPNSLPSHPPEVKLEPSAIHSVQQQQQQQQQQASSSNEGEEEKKTGPQYCTLNTLPEGQIGNIKVYQSGKVELWLGNHKLAVSQGTQVGFLQDVVSVDVDSQSKTGTMTVLGHVGHRLVCTPDLEALVRQMKT